MRRGINQRLGWFAFDLPGEQQATWRRQCEEKGRRPIVRSAVPRLRRRSTGERNAQLWRWGTDLAGHAQSMRTLAKNTCAEGCPGDTTVSPSTATLPPPPSTAYSPLRSKRIVADQAAASDESMEATRTRSAGTLGQEPERLVLHLLRNKHREEQRISLPKRSAERLGWRLACRVRERGRTAPARQSCQAPRPIAWRPTAETPTRRCRAGRSLGAHLRESGPSDACGNARRPAQPRSARAPAASGLPLSRGSSFHGTRTARSSWAAKVVHRFDSASTNKERAE